PMMTAMARSRTLPRTAKSRKSFSIASLLSGAGSQRRPGESSGGPADQPDGADVMRVVRDDFQQHPGHVAEQVAGERQPDTVPPRGGDDAERAARRAERPFLEAPGAEVTEAELIPALGVDRARADRDPHDDARR